MFPIEILSHNLPELVKSAPCDRVYEWAVAVDQSLQAKQMEVVKLLQKTGTEVCSWMPRVFF